MRIPRFVVACFAIDVVLAVASLFTVWMGDTYWIVRALLHVGSERAVATWYSSIQLFVIAGLVAVYAACTRNTSGGRIWPLWALAFMFLLLSMDEILQVHEWLGGLTDKLLPGGTREGTAFDCTGIWMFVIGGPFLVCFLLLMLVIKKHLKAVPGAFTKITLGMIVLLTGALGMETLSRKRAAPGSYSGLQTIEEFLEMAGATIILWGALALARRRANLQWCNN